MARTDANAANLIPSDVDERDRLFLTGERTAEGYFRVRSGLDQAIARGLAYAPYSDLLWCETARPDLDEAEGEESTLALLGSTEEEHSGNESVSRSVVSC